MKTDSGIVNADYRSLNRDIFSYLAARISPRSRPTMARLGIVVLLVFAVISGIGYGISARIEHIAFNTETTVPYFMSTLYIAALILICEKIMEKLLATTEQKIVPALRSAEDLEALKRRLQRMFDKRNQAYFAALFTLGIHLLFVLPNPGLIRTFGWGILVANTVMNFFHGVCVYFVYSFAFWAFTELKEYDFSLYSLDPSSSEIVRILAGMFNAVLYTILVMITIITIVFVRFKVLTPVSVVITMVLMWVTASAIFTFNQLILARIIQKGKWKTLNEIQAEIIALQIKETPPSSETLEHIDKLVNLHNSVKATPNSALSLRSFLEFINSLLLPTIGVVLSTINDVQGLVEKLLKLKLF